jgi:anti-sigma factor RsiW
VQAHFDGELDAVSAAAIEQHLELCAECRALLQSLEQVRTVIRDELTYHRAPVALESRIARALEHQAATDARHAARPGILQRMRTAWPNRSRGRSFWTGALGGMGITAAAATATFLLLSPAPDDSMIDDLVAAHARSLMPSHLIDVESTDHHTVKPWFAGHADVSPVVANFSQQGYQLVGGRADFLGHQRSAAVVYRHGAHVINVFSWSGDPADLPETASRLGFRMAFWRSGDLQYCAVSDTGWDELMGLVRLLQERSARELRE